MLPETGEVHEAKIDRPDLLLADEGQNFFGCHVRIPPHGKHPFARPSSRGVAVHGVCGLITTAPHEGEETSPTGPGGDVVLRDRKKEESRTPGLSE
jgi:hypothetical protein